jgi:predicted P-loop ATPase
LDTEILNNYVALKLPLVRISKKKIPPPEGKEGGKWRRVPEEKWKGIEHTQRYPESFHDCNVAIKTGHVLPDGRRLYVLDIDLKNPKGQDSLLYMEMNYDLDLDKLPFVSLTESRGYHVYFASKLELQVCTNLMAGIDFLGMGSIAFEAPSQFYEGAHVCEPYKWLSEPLSPFAEDIPELPEWLSTIIEQKNGVKRMFEARYKAREDDEAANLQGGSLEFVSQCLAHYTPPMGLVYDDWLKIGMALHDATGGSAQGFEVFNAWGERVARECNGEYDDKKTIISWDSFGQRNSGAFIRFGTLVRYLCKDPNCISFIRQSSDTILGLSKLIKETHESLASCETEADQHEDLSRFQELIESRDVNNIDTLPEDLEDPKLLAELTSPKYDERLKGDFTDKDLAVWDKFAEKLETDEERKLFEKQVAKLHNSIKVVEPDDGIRVNFYKLVQNVGLSGVNLRFNALTLQREASFDGGCEWQPICEAIEGDLLARCREKSVMFDEKELGKNGYTKAAIYFIARQNTVNPIKEYMNNCLKLYRLEVKKQGITSTRHFRDAFATHIDMQSPEMNSRFVRCTEHWMQGIICRIFYKYTNKMLILEGFQGLGKSTFAKALTKHIGLDYYYAGAIDPRDKDHRIKVASLLIWEPDELEATTGKDMARLKNFVTQTKIDERPAYAKAKIVAPVMCALIGSTNEYQYLRDSTGSRRFIVCDFYQKDVERWVNYLYSSAFNPSMLFGETYHDLLKNNRMTPYPDKELDTDISERNEESRYVPHVEEIVNTYLEIGTEDDFITHRQLRDIITTYNDKCDEKDYVEAKKAVIKMVGRIPKEVDTRIRVKNGERAYVFRYVRLLDLGGAKMPDNV